VEELDRLVDEYWSYYLETNPTEAHLLGHYEHASAFESASRESEDARIAALRDFARRAEALPELGLEDQQGLTRAVLAFDSTTRADLAEQRLAELTADPIFGVQVSVPIVVGMLALPDADVADAMVEKYRGLARHYRELVERQREGIGGGRVSAAFAVTATIQQLDGILGSQVDEDALMRTTQPPDDVDVEAWRARLREVITAEVRPAMAAYRDVLRDEALPRARPDEQAGLSWLPDGEAAYAAALRYYTTTTRSAQEIHDLGREIIARLADEYRALGKEVVGTDDIDRIFEALRNDPELHFTGGEEMVEASKAAMARAWDAMPDWFEVLPQAPCDVQGTRTGPKAFYFPPAADGSRGGTFFVNVEDPRSWGTFELQAMAFHEGIPGHHLQLAIAGELTGVPELRKHLHNSAYAEGWGLYTERLADEMGLYSGPVDRIGMLSADSMRACRLVVDTGVHALGWSRAHAVDYMVGNSPMREAMCQPEVDRYLVSPGQACSYMVGRVELQRMRAAAEQRLGDRFDVRRFHTAVLENGSLPLGVLDDVVTSRLGG
jgi:uncharacterized protein (DUF885 family)